MGTCFKTEKKEKKRNDAIQVAGGFWILGDSDSARMDPFKVPVYIFFLGEYCNTAAPENVFADYETSTD